MGSLSIWHWLIVLALAALFFGGRGKLSGIMGDAAKGIRAFREGLKDEAAPEPEPEPEPKPLPKSTATRTRAKTKASS